MMRIDDLVVFIESSLENFERQTKSPRVRIAASSSTDAVHFFIRMHNEMFSVALADNNILINAVLAMMRSIR